MAYRDEVGALRAQRDAAEAELKELRVEAERLRDVHHELEHSERQVRILEQQLRRLRSLSDPEVRRSRARTVVLAALGSFTCISMMSLASVDHHRLPPSAVNYEPPRIQAVVLPNEVEPPPELVLPLVSESPMPPEVPMAEEKAEFSEAKRRELRRKAQARLRSRARGGR